MWKRYKLLHDFNDRFRREFFLAVRQCRRCAIWRRPAKRLAWWAEICEVPCVGFAANADEVPALGRAGADFIAIGDFVWADARGPRLAVAEAAQRLRLPEAVR